WSETPFPSPGRPAPPDASRPETASSKGPIPGEPPSMPLRSCLRLLSYLAWFGGEQAVELGVPGEMIHKGKNHVAVEQQPLAFPRMGDIGELMRRNAEPGCENFSVPGGLIEHVDKVGVLKDVLHLAGGKQVLDVLGDPCWHTAPFPETLPNLDAVRRG